MLALTSFCGTVAHLTYFRSQLVERHGWLSEAEFEDTVALRLAGIVHSQSA